MLAILAYGQPRYQVSPAEPVDTKNCAADAMIYMAEGVALGLRLHIEAVEVSTPRTDMRHAGTLGGSI
jgi:hypothetical protein